MKDRGQKMTTELTEKILRAIQADIAEIKERLGAIEERLIGVEDEIAGINLTLVRAVGQIDRRVKRLEKK